MALWRAGIALPVAGCSYAPTLDLLGSYFPGWMLCTVLGVAAAVIIRQILAVAGINEYVVAPLLTYAGHRENLPDDDGSGDAEYRA